MAWVTGASRGIGRGVAAALGGAGWTVYVTARSTAAARTTGLPGTVEDCAAAVTAAGGLGVPVPCDHRDDTAVTAVAARIAAAHGRLDLLVNNAWGGYERLAAGAWDEWNAPMWQQPVELFDAMFASGVRAHYVALARSAPLLIAAPGSLAVTVSMAIPGSGQHAGAPGAPSAPGAPGGPAYAMAKAADDRLAQAAAAQLREHRVASVAVHPGWVRTETVLRYAEHLDLNGSQSPAGVGRAITALAADPQLMTLTGRALAVAELASRYGIDVTA